MDLLTYCILSTKFGMLRCIDGNNYTSVICSYNGRRDFDITEIDITQSAITEFDITDTAITESDITESAITRKGKLL